MSVSMLSKYIAKNRSGALFTNNELQVIKQGEVGQMIDTFLDLNNDYYKEQMQCAMKSLSLFLGDGLEIEDIRYQKEYLGQFVGCQVMDGDVDVFLGVAGDNVNLLKVASTFSQEELEEFNMDAYDALCELINIMNGAFATKLSNREIEVTLHPPVFYLNTKIKADAGFYVVTFIMDEYEFRILMAADNRVEMIA